MRGFADQHAYVAAAIAALADLPLRAEVDAAVQASEPEAYGGAPAVTTPIEVRPSAGGRSESYESCVYAFTRLYVNIHLNSARSEPCGGAGVGGRGGARSLCARRLAAALRPVDRRDGHAARPRRCGA